MKNDRRNLLAGCTVVVIAGVLIWLYWPRKSEPQNAPVAGQSAFPSPAPAQSPLATPSASLSARPAFTPLSEAEIKRQQEQQWSLLFMTPISIYGKVVDENWKPVSGATVKIGLNDNPLPNATGSVHIKTTDERGLFSLMGHGIAFSLRASKSGYYTTQESRGGRNVTVPTKGDLPQPTKEQPIVLMLRKQGETVPLIFTSSRQIDVPRTWQPISIDLATGHTGQGNLQVSSWLGRGSQRRFDWRYELSILGGGLSERKGSSILKRLPMAMNQPWKSACLQRRKDGLPMLQKNTL